MRIVLMLGLVFAACIAYGQSGGDSLVDRQLAAYAAIRTVRCDIRRETDMDGKRINTLSRVWFQRPDRLRVETVTPAARRILVDGTAIYKWVDGDAEGVRIPLAEAAGNELLQVRKTPGTADEYLQPLRGLAEIELPGSGTFSIRRAYVPPEPHPYTEVSFDDLGRMAKIEFFDSGNRSLRLVSVDFSSWKEAAPGIWFPCLQKTIAKSRDGTEVMETLRVSALVVNEFIEPERFNLKNHAPDVFFVSVEEMVDILKNNGSPAKIRSKSP